jgi:hypothetical protein
VGEGVVAQRVDPLGAVLLVLGLTDDLLGMDLARRFLEGRAGNIRPPRGDWVATLASDLAGSTRLLSRFGQRNPRDAAQPDVTTLAANHGPENPGFASTPADYQGESIAVDVVTR